MREQTQLSLFPNDDRETHHPLSRHVFSLGIRGALKSERAPLLQMQSELAIDVLADDDLSRLAQRLSRPAPHRETVVSEAESLISKELKVAPLIIGVDEAGRGPWAGPVVAAAVILPEGFGVNAPLPPELKYLKDSKQLSESRRLQMIRPLCHAALAVGVGVADATIIDETSITRANYMAMYLAIVRALRSLSRSPSSPLSKGRRAALTLVDGKYPVPPLTLSQISMIKGDQRSYNIAAASIVAKVTRDKMMIAAHRRYPEYGFNRHKGYGTRAHQEALQTHGPCPLHRRSFRPISALLS